MEGRKKDCPQCPFFDICGAYIIREMRAENWYQQFCCADFEKCVHFKDGNAKKEFITKP